MALLHGTVGTQHAAMAIYNAYADRVPIYLVIGNHMDAAVRPGGVNWYHSAQDMAAAQAAVNQAKAKLDALKAGGTTSEIAAAQAGVDQAQEALNKLKAGPTAEDIRQAQEGVNQTFHGLDSRRAKANSYQLSDPVVTEWR